MIDVNVEHDDLKKACVFYESIRERDRDVYTVQHEVCAEIFDAVGYFPHNNGSFGLWLNLTISDLDLAIGVPEAEQLAVVEKLSSNGWQFIGVRKSTPDSERYILKCERQGISIDLGVLPPRDFEWTVIGMNSCRSGMKHADRVFHVWKKKQLLEQDKLEEYREFKLLPYQQFFPGTFLFVPIL